MPKKLTDNEKFRLMCHYYLSLMEGDTHRIEDAMKLMRKEGIIDENDEEIED